MSDASVEEQEPEVVPASTEQQEEEKRLSGAAATSTMKALRKKLEDEQKKVRELEREKQERADAEKSEVERLTGTVSRLQADLAERDAREAVSKREGYVLRAAKDFTDPDEVVAILAHRGELEGIESEQDAERALKQLAKDRTHLLRKTPAEDAANHFEQVLKDGQEPNRTADPTRKSVITPADLVAMTDEQQRELKRTNPDLYWRSVEGLNDGPETTHTVHR